MCSVSAIAYLTTVAAGDIITARLCTHRLVCRDAAADEGARERDAMISKKTSFLFFCQLLPFSLANH